MNLDRLKSRFPDENACRNFFETIIWQNGRCCPHCDCETSYFLSGPSSRPGLYECGRCKRQFIVTTRTPMHSTKLPLWTSLLCMYFMVNSSKGVSSVFMGKWLGVAQRTAWKMAHAVRELMKPGPDGRPPLDGIVEVACLVDKKGVQPTHFGRLPTQLAALNAQHMAFHDLVATAVLEQDREEAVHALMLDPLTAAVCSLEEIRQMFDEMAEAQRDYLPEFLHS